VELPVTLTVEGTPVELRRATAADLPALVGLLADDPLGAAREFADGDLSPYRRAFGLLDADPAHLLVAAVDGDTVVGTLQLTFLPGLARRGALRAQIEGYGCRPVPAAAAWVRRWSDGRSGRPGGGDAASCS
jgi:hypothetical protein